MKVLITGGTGFVGSHVAEYYARKGDEVTIFDNLSRAMLLGHCIANITYNWNYLKFNYKKQKFTICLQNMKHLEWSL